MKQFTRRQFAKTTFAAAAALSLPARSWSQVAGANSDIRGAVVGFNGRGGSHVSAFSRMEGVRLTALCDADRNVLDRGVARAKAGGHEVEGYTDIRKLLESKNVDVIAIASPNHWHSLSSIWAVQAGKDVYLEKPISHNVWEGRQLVNAARKYNRIVQTGTQCRSSTGITEAVAWVQAGNLGKITVSRGMCYKRRASIGKVDGPQPIPEHIDYDLWCGPAEKLPLMRERLHYDWHWVWNTGNGDLGNQGIHQMDIARWFVGEPALAPRVLSIGGRLGYIDDGETANTQYVYQDYPNAPLIFEVRGLPAKSGVREMDKFMGGGVAVVVHCEGGHVLVPTYSSAIAFDKNGTEIKQWRGGGNHMQDFIGAVKSRKHTDLTADVLEGHLSSALCHTGNVSLRLGKLASPNEMAEAVKAYPAAAETHGRMIEHLAANGVDITKEKVTLGAWLTMNPATEKFTAAAGADLAKANALLTREYREPFVVPANV